MVYCSSVLILQLKSIVRGDVTDVWAKTKSLVQAYAPYSQCPAGVALITDSGDVYSGGYIESAAYNPSLPPLQTAVVDAVIDHIPCFSSVVEVIVVEHANAAVKHELSVMCMLPQVAAHAKLSILSVDAVL